MSFGILGGGEFGLGLGRVGCAANGFAEGRAQDAVFGDDCGDVLRGRHVKGGVLDGDAMRGDLAAIDVGDLASAALLNGDQVAGGGFGVDGVERRGDVERDAMLAGQDGDGVGTDLVGGVAIA
jgi:hypothetical protein